MFKNNCGPPVGVFAATGWAAGAAGTSLAFAVVNSADEGHNLPVRASYDADPTARHAGRHELSGRLRQSHAAIVCKDASHYQIEPLAVAFPRDAKQAAAIIQAAAQAGVAVIPRGPHGLVVAHRRGVGGGFRAL